MYTSITINEIKELIESLNEPYLITDGVNILDISINLDTVAYLSIATSDEDITIKKENDEYLIERNKAEESNDDRSDFSPFSEGDKDPNSNFCDITPEGAKLEDLFDITIGDIIHLREDHLRSKYTVKEDCGYLYFQRIPSMIFEALDTTRVRYSNSRCIEADILMLLKQNVSDGDKRNILEIINQAITDTLELPGDESEASFIWNINNYRVKAYIENIDKREYAIVSVTRE